MTGRRVVTVAVAACVLLAGTAHAEVWQHDEFSKDPGAAVEETNGVEMGAHPGFVAGEAFGQIYTPAPGTYPVTITGFDLITMGPPETPEFQAHFNIEIYIDPGVPDSAAPSVASPDFQISTSDMAASIGGILNDKGQVKAGTFYSATFDKDDPDGYPPQVGPGNKIWLMVRYTSEATYTVSWDGCTGGCGCQSIVCPVDTDGITPQVNVMHVTGGGCNDPASEWYFQEDLVDLLGVFGQNYPKGDFLMRLRVTPGSGGSCSCDGKECGTDGCGVSCGECGNGFVCVQGACIDEGGGPCETQCSGKSCGDDGCGGVCGLCSGDDVCVQGLCTDPGGGCTSDCAGKDCGDDGCGGVCGVCTGEEICIQGVCSDPGGGCETDCSGKNCGDDGCGGLCGVCGGEQVCIQGVCTDTGPDCVTDCTGKACGGDGCGGTCGACATDTVCSEGQCISVGDDAALTVSGISPNTGFTDDSIAVAISGTGFHAGMKARLGTTSLGITGVTGSTLADALVPSGMEAGTYNLILITSDNEDTATLTDAFTVEERASCGDGVCDSLTETCESCALDCGVCEQEGSAPSGGCATGSEVPLGLALLAVLTALLAIRPRRPRADRR